MCFNAATHVLDHHRLRRLALGAHRMPCVNRQVRLEAQVAAADELGIMHGRTGA
ncbi:hypothetical protein ACWCQZ_47520 [Streptomyces sp. NPDC002285]